MTKVALALLALLGLAQLPAQAACNYPADVSVPDGKSATEEEIIAGQKVVKDYMAEMESYQDCLDQEQKALGDAVTAEQKAMHVKRYNAAVDAMESVANRFNEQLRAFKAKKK